jgi:hypothetical protein
MGPQYLCTRGIIDGSSSAVWLGWSCVIATQVSNNVHIKYFVLNNQEMVSSRPYFNHSPHREDALTLLCPVGVELPISTLTDQPETILSSPAVSFGEVGMGDRGHFDVVGASPLMETTFGADWAAAVLTDAGTGLDDSCSWPLAHVLHVLRSLGPGSIPCC